MSNEESKQEDINLMEEFLDQHDYKEPTVGDIRKGIIVAITPQGVIVDLGLKRDGLVPSSDLSKMEPEDRAALKIDDEVPIYVTNTDAPDSLYVSIHMAQLNQDWIDAEALMESGKILEGEVIGYNKGGAIIPFGRLRAFVPASHLSALSRGLNDRQRQQKLAKLRGEKVPVKVIEVDRRRRRLVFSQREAQKEWEDKRKAELLKDLKEGDTLKGRVSGMRDFGVFVDLGGADGLVHISELAWHRIDHPREVLKVGDEIEVYVLNINAKSQRISLSRKRLLANPWSTVEERYEQNQLVEGKITRIVDYGAFAEIEPGVEGLLHVSQLSHGQVDKPSDVVNNGDIHLLRIVNIDPERQRIGLSLRAVNTHEQIEWMASREPEVVEEEETEETAVATEDAATPDETTETAVAKVETETEDEAEEVAVEVADTIDETADSAVAEVQVEDESNEAVAEPKVVETKEEEEEEEEVVEEEKVEAEEIATDESGDAEETAVSDNESEESEEENE